jgi:soluble lytic murein transglycosylase-like protein
VSVLQFLLARRGFRPGLIGGYFNGQTRRALERYQRSVRLRADGIAGRATIAALSFQARVPVRNEPARTYYVVRRGDTLTSIAERFHVTVRALAAANRLDPKAVLPAGRRLVIPGGSSRLIVAAPWTIRALIDYWSHRYRVDPHLVRAVAWMESGYQTTVVSSSGAVGVMQILPSTRRYVETVLIGHRVRDDASGNIQVGVVYLRHLLRRFNGRRRLALAAWHEGPAALRRHGIFPETRRFVAAVLALSRRM